MGGGGLIRIFEAIEKEGKCKDWMRCRRERNKKREERRHRYKNNFEMYDGKS
jgi:hypothetical protein